MTAVAEKPAQEIVSESDTPIYEELKKTLGDPKSVFPADLFTLPEGEFPDPAGFRDIYLTHGVDPTYPPFLEFPATSVLLAACENASPAEVITALEEFAQDPVSGRVAGELDGESGDTERILAASHAREAEDKAREEAFWMSHYRIPTELSDPDATRFFTPVWAGEEE